MSNYVHIVCKLRDIEKNIMEEAFERMGLIVDYDTNEMLDYFSPDPVKCSAVVRIKEKDFILMGLNLKNSNSISVVEFIKINSYMMQDYLLIKSEKEFEERFNVEYNCVKIIKQTAELGYQVDFEENLEDGTRKLVVYRVA